MERIFKTGDIVYIKPLKDKGVILDFCNDVYTEETYACCLRDEDVKKQNYKKYIVKLEDLDYIKDVFKAFEEFLKSEIVT